MPATASSQPDSFAPAPVPAAQRANALASPLAASWRSLPIALKVSGVFISVADLTKSFATSPGCSFMCFSCAAVSWLVFSRASA